MSKWWGGAMVEAKGSVKMVGVKKSKARDGGVGNELWSRTPRRSVPLSAREGTERNGVRSLQKAGSDTGVRSLPKKRELMWLYKRLLAYYGVQNWWPAESAWEIMVGAILTQNTAWQNVDRALENLRRENVLNPDAMRTIELERLRELVRSAGFVTSKPGRLKGLAQFLFAEYGGDTANLRGGELDRQRAQFLALNGIGPETADAILLYVADKPTFVIDAYTRRILYRLGWTDENAGYDELQRLFMAQLPPDVGLFKEFHALLDVHAKRTCTKRAPRCAVCPLRRRCVRRGVVLQKAG